MKRGTPDHPKVAHLCSLLNCSLPEAVGILELLWHFTAKFAPQGDIGKYTDAAIAKAVGWQKRSGSRGVPTEVRLRSALVQAGFMDACQKHRLVVHDWHDHADQAVTKFLSRHGLDFVRPVDSLPLPEPVSRSQKPEPIRATDIEHHVPQAPAPPAVHTLPPPLLDAKRPIPIPTRNGHTPLPQGRELHLELAFRDLWDAYPASGRTCRGETRQAYMDFMGPLHEDSRQEVHERMISAVRPSGKWHASEVWSKGMVCALKKYITEQRWDEDPAPRKPEDHIPTQGEFSAAVTEYARSGRKML